MKARFRKMARLGHVSQALLRTPKAFFCARDYLFVIGHMRSYSSLLCHILGSHPEISGYSEMHQHYYNAVDLAQLRHRVYLANDKQLKGRFVLDKLVDGHKIAGNVLRRPDVHCLFLIRNAEDTLKSIVHMGKTMIDYGWYQDIAQVAAYYAKQLEKIQCYAKQTIGTAVFLEAERIVETPSQTLTALTEVLGLTEPLREDYSIFAQTGVPGHCDPSDNIKTGKVVPGRQTHEEILIPAPLKEQAEEAYWKCVTALRRCCTCI